MSFQISSTSPFSSGSSFHLLKSFFLKINMVIFYIFFIQQDINDNAPVFEKSIYRVTVSEDAEYGCKYILSSRMFSWTKRFCCCFSLIPYFICLSKICLMNPMSFKKLFRALNSKLS